VTGGGGTLKSVPGFTVLELRANATSDAVAARSTSHPHRERYAATFARRAIARDMTPTVVRASAEKSLPIASFSAAPPRREGSSETPRDAPTRPSGRDGRETGLNECEIIE
tara:strand:+ start:1488 stop:1820 length:333 start_codon:yes stop_codon:yes gene_type:complete